MDITKVVPANSRVDDKTTREELNKLYAQISILIDALRNVQERVAKLEGN